MIDPELADSDKAQEPAASTPEEKTISGELSSPPKNNVSADDAEPLPKPARNLRNYLLSALTALLLLGIIALIWSLILNAPFAPLPGETVITTQAELNTFLQANAPKLTSGDGPYYVPTGMVIQSLEFKGPYSIQVSGYVWQRYADSLPADLQKGIVFSEADTTTLTKVYETHQGNETVVGWSFKATLREQFDYSRYPLDHQVIWIRLWHVEFEKDVYMVPDIAGYISLEPSLKPGLDPGLVLENWRFENSYFSLRMNAYNANFGIQGYQSNLPQPELYFNISIQRYILSALVARGLAPLIILIQLFVLVMVIGSDEKRLEQFGVRPGAVIFTCAAFFFAILVAQNALREELKWYGIVYLETLYIITYIVILLVSINAVVLVAFPNVRVLRRDNQYIELLYWPLIVGIVLLLTLLVFFDIKIVL